MISGSSNSINKRTTNNFNKNNFNKTKNTKQSTQKVGHRTNRKQYQPNYEKKFKFICVLDFEAVFSDDPKTNKNVDMEIIEFPSVLLKFTSEKKLEVVDHFQFYVKTRRIPKLNQICMDVTGITQEMVDNGIDFEKAAIEHTKWLEKHLGEPVNDTNVLMATCGDWDLKTMLPHQLKFEPQVKPFVKSHLNQWCNVKDVYGIFYNVKKVSGMLTMLNGLNLKLEGHHHSGIDDCKNIARVVIEMVSAGCSFGITGKYELNDELVFYEYNPKQKLNNFEII
ncbi:hypothetical protein ABK040_015384 [Willaertia magna]